MKQVCSLIAIAGENHKCDPDNPDNYRESGSSIFNFKFIYR